MRLDPFDLARAIATLDTLGIPRGTRGMSEDRLVDAGGMRPHLRLALGHDRALELHRAGRAGWAIGPLTGHNMRAGDTDPSIHAGDDAALLVAMVGVASWSGHGSPDLDAWSMDRSVCGHHGADRLAEWIRSIEEVPAATTVESRRATAIRSLCRTLGMGDPYSALMDVQGLWTEHHVDGVVAVVQTCRNDWYDIMVDLSDNRREHLRWTSIHDAPSSWVRASWDRPRVGERLRIEYVGRTPEHRGHVRYIRNLDEVEASERRKALIEIMTRPVPIPLYADGTSVSPRDRVRLEAGCLEASRGAEGRVTSLCGELVMVRFEGRRRPVPCYPDALSRIVPTDREPIAA